MIIKSIIFYGWKDRILQGFGMEMIGMCRSLKGLGLEEGFGLGFTVFWNLGKIGLFLDGLGELDST